MPLGPNTLKTINVGYQCPTQPIASTHPSSTYLRCNLRNGLTCTTRYLASASLQARLGNSSQTYFQAKQAGRSRRVSRADLPPSVLWPNRQTEAHLVLRTKPRNRCGDFEAQIINPALPVLRPKPGTPHHLGFEAQPRSRPPILRSNREKTIATSFKAKLEKTVAAGFEAKPLETVRVVLRPNHSQTVDLSFEAQPRNPLS
jgi:hypothetical protein